MHNMSFLHHLIALPAGSQHSLGANNMTEFSYRHGVPSLVLLVSVEKASKQMGQTSKEATIVSFTGHQIIYQSSPSLSHLAMLYVR